MLKVGYKNSMINSNTLTISTLILTATLLSACGGGSSGSSTPTPPVTPPPVVDTVAPVLSLVGDANISLDAGTEFSDDGATANDDVDGSITANISVSGSVNTDVPGEYPLTYNVSDAAGNAAIELTRQVTVDAVPVMQVTIDTQGATIVDEPKILASMQITDKGQMIYDGNLGIEIRGSSSQMFEKKSYGFETWDEQGEDLEVELAGFPEEEDWIFYAPYSDKSLVRNVLIYDLSNQMARYAVRTKFAEVTINNDYRGTYVFMEKIKRDKNRLDISKLKSDDITGGYIIKIDKITGEDPLIDFSFDSKFDGFGDENGLQKIKFLYEYPKPEDIELNEKQYIQTYFANFEDALMADDFADAQAGYRQYIDVPSFIDFFLLNELSHNVDAYRISTFMHKDKGEKLKMGPIWDFNIAFGNADYCRGQTTVDWAYQFNTYCPNDPSRVPFWWARLLQDESFVAALKSRWNSLRADILSQENINMTIEKHVDTLRHGAVIDKNFQRFNILGIYVWPNFFIGDSYDDELAYLKQWISLRTAWMDQSIEQL